VPFSNCKHYRQELFRS